MNFIELQTVLQKLTERKITQSDFARILNVGRANISDRNKRNSQVTTRELELIQNFFNIKYYFKADDKNFKICKNTKERHFINNLAEKHKKLGERLSEIQSINNLTDIQMSGLLNISEQELIRIKKDEILPELGIIDNIKQNFNISVDWLLYGN